VKTVFFDVDTQIDFVFPAGALYVPGADEVLPAVARLNRYAVDNRIPLISTMDAHTENDPEFRDWPPHCITGTIGQRKPAGTVIDRVAVVPPVEGTVTVIDAPQIILEKVSTNCFTNPNLEAVLKLLEPERYVVYGVVTEVCVKFAALGLLRTGARVELVTDAVRHLSESARDALFSEFTTAGGVLRTSADICR
jgi:nicotinamidase/pyrazinamidase